MFKVCAISEYTWLICQGLCGNFNNDPRDDLEGRDGDQLASPAEFTASWRADETCGTGPEVPDECESNPQMKVTAEAKCGLLMERMFVGKALCPFL